ncbi:ATP-binding cassette domain-containing protein, partial [bacterium]|nr:ATP-binding cassette domain-containing protein [bacterium]
LPHRRRSSMGVVPQEIALYDMLTATANLHVFGAVQGLTGVQLRERIGFVLDAVGLTERAHSRVKTFSGGMKRRLNLAVGLLSDPEVLLLDEPTVGVDPQSRASIFALLRSLNESGKTILYTTHYMEEAERLCGRIGILDHGQLLAEGTLTELVEKVELPRTIRVSGTAFMESPPKLKSAAHRATHDAVEYIPRDPSQLGAVVRELEESRTVYDRLEVIGPNLETLFLQLTGRELRN